MGAIVDLNLIRVFAAVHETRSFTKAAARLFVTQSAVSQSMARLRDELDDVLFERHGRSVRPTTVADSVYPAFRDALAGIDGALDGIRRFDPLSSEHVFRIALSELGEIGWIPDLVLHLRDVAPGVQIEIVPLAAADLLDSLNRGSVDLAISPQQLPPSFQRTHVKAQHYEVVMSASHPAATAPITTRDYGELDHVDVAGDTGAARLEDARRAAGLSIRPVVRVQHFATLAPMLERSSALVATIPETIADGWAATHRIIARPVPFPMQPVEIGLYRRRSSQAFGAIEWFHGEVARAVAGSGGEFSALIG